MIDDTRLNEIEARSNAATPGPWRADKSEQVQYRTVGAGFDGKECVQSWSGSDAHYANGSRMGDAEFIAHAREDVPYLLDEVYRLNLRAAHLEQSRDEWFRRARRRMARIEELEAAAAHARMPHPRCPLDCAEYPGCGPGEKLWCCRWEEEESDG